MGMIQTKCEKCSELIEFDETFAGQLVPCPVCRAETRLLAPAVQTAVFGGRLMQAVPLKSRLLAFVLTFISGPFGFFYVSWRLGVMSVLAFLVAVGLHFGLNKATLEGWPVGVPTLEIHFVLGIVLAVLQQILFAGFAARLARERNHAITTGDPAEYQKFKDSRHCLFVMGFLYGLLLVVPWALNDLIIAVLSVLHGHFLMGVGHLVLPHAIVAGVGYGIGMAIISALLPRRLSPG